MQVSRSNRNPALFALALAGYRLLVLVVAAGFSSITGSAHASGGVVYKIPGAVMVAARIAAFGTTVRRWSEYFFAFCFVMAVKARLALFVGYTISQRRLIVTRTVARTQTAECLVLLLAMSFLSYRYASHAPRTAFESVGLVSAVLSLALEMSLDPNMWPVIGGVSSASFASADIKTKDRRRGLDRLHLMIERRPR